MKLSLHWVIVPRLGYRKGFWSASILSLVHTNLILSTPQTVVMKVLYAAFIRYTLGRKWRRCCFYVNLNNSYVSIVGVEMNIVLRVLYNRQHNKFVINKPILLYWHSFYYAHMLHVSIQLDHYQAIVFIKYTIRYWIVFLMWIHISNP
jgi:hypothetical protein